MGQTAKHRQELHRLHREGRLQRLLDLSPNIPFSKHFPEAQELRDASTLDHSRKDKQKSKSATNGHAKSKHESTPRRNRHDSPGVGAIEVEDDEVEFDDYSDAFDSEDDANATFSEGSDNDDIEEIFPQIMGALKKSGKDRYQSVSEDSDEDDIKILSQDEEEETRYNMKEKKSKSGSKSKSKDWKTNLKVDTESEDEDGEIHDTPPVKKATDGLSKQQKKDRKASRKAFWDAKGVPEAEDEEEEEGEEGEVVE
jgi:hypothetical protein